MYETSVKIRHENFTSCDDHENNNIGLLKTRDKIAFSEKVERLLLPLKNPARLTARLVSVAGWGN